MKKQSPRDDIIFKEYKKDNSFIKENWEDIYAILMDKDSLIHVEGTDVFEKYTVEKYSKECDEFVSNNGAIFFICSKIFENRIIGIITLSNFYNKNWNKTNRKPGSLLIYYIHPEFRGMGYGKKAILALIHIFNNKENVTKIRANVFSMNERSLNLLLKCGFTIVGIATEVLTYKNKNYDFITLEYSKNLSSSELKKRLARYLKLNSYMMNYWK